jgi:signal transduction histidine kinase
VSIRRSVLTLRESRRMIADDLAATARLQDLSTRLLYPADLNALLQEILAAAAGLTGTDKGNIQILDPATGRLRLLVHQGLSPQFVEFFADDGWGVTCGAAAANKARVIIEDIERVPALRAAEAFTVLRRDDIRAVQSTPLISRDGRVLGVLNNHFRVPTRPSERQLRYIDLLARMAADLIERCQSEDALREADRRKDEFLAALGHELRGPLAPLRNTLEIMKRMGNGSPAEQQARETMQRQLTHLTRLVDDLVDVSRITHNKILLRVERVELAAVIHQALEAAQPLAAKADLRVRADVPVEPIYLQGDPVRLVQVFGNILNNACKYTGAGGEIRVDVTRDGNEAVVRIKDTGVGIPPDQLTHVFDLFTQIDVPFERTHGGLGIGLTIVKRLVEMHGGSIAVHSEGLQRGSEFIVRLPLGNEGIAEKPMEASHTG